MSVRATVIALGLGLVACKQPSSAEREQAAIEGRNLDGSSPPARDDRIPAFEPIEPVGAEPGFVPGSIAYLNSSAELLAWALAAGEGVGELDRLRAVLGEHGDARVRVAIAGLGSGPEAAVHVRVTADPVLVEPLLAWLREGSEPEPSCAELDPAAVWCGVGAGRIAVARVDAGRLVLDQLEGPDGPGGRAREWLRTALARASEPASAEIAGLGGDAVAWVDAAALVAWSGDAIAPLWTDARLFDGATLELDLRGATGEADRELLGRLRWRVRSGEAARVAEAFSLDPVDADVPTLASLCAGASVCVRGRGIPAAGRFVGLAEGAYADPVRLADAVAGHELGPLLLALATWPNALGAASRWPTLADDATERMLFDELAEVSGRALGFGYVVRETGRVGYARVSGADLASVRGYLGLAGTSFAGVWIDDVDGRVEVGTGPSLHRSLPRRLYARFDPGEAWGWLVAAESDADLQWLAKLPRDDGAVPIVYAELADLGTTLAAFVRVPGLAGVRMQAQLALDSTRTPELRLALRRGGG